MRQLTRHVQTALDKLQKSTKTWDNSLNQILKSNSLQKILRETSNFTKSNSELSKKLTESILDLKNESKSLFGNLQKGIDEKISQLQLSNKIIQENSQISPQIKNSLKSRQSSKNIKIISPIDTKRILKRTAADFVSKRFKGSENK